MEPQRIWLFLLYPNLEECFLQVAVSKIGWNRDVMRMFQSKFCKGGLGLRLSFNDGCFTFSRTKAS